MAINRLELPKVKKSIADRKPYFFSIMEAKSTKISLPKIKFVTDGVIQGKPPY